MTGAEVARTMGIGEFVIGAVIVAVGTTVPELATTIVSKLRGYEEVGLGGAWQHCVQRLFHRRGGCDDSPDSG